MKQSVRTILNIILLGAVILFFSVVVFYKGNTPSIRGLQSSGKQERKHLTVEGVQPELSLFEPVKLAGLFGYREPVAAVPVKPIETTLETPVNAVESIEASWLSYIGYVEDTDESGVYYFKDTRNGKAIKVSTGQTDEAGWALVENTDEWFILGYEDQQYRVLKR